MRTPLSRMIVPVLVVAGTVASSPAQAEACEDPWSCFAGPSYADVIEQYHSYEIGLSWGTDIHDWVMQVPAEVPVRGDLTAGDVGSPTSDVAGGLGSLDSNFWD